MSQSEAKPNTLEQWIKDHPWTGPFRSRAYHNLTGNFVECYFENVDAYAEDETCENVTVLRAMDATRRIVGFKIWNPDGLRQEALARAAERQEQRHPRWAAVNRVMPLVCFLSFVGAFVMLAWMRGDTIARFPWAMGYLLGVCAPLVVLMVAACRAMVPDETRRAGRG